MLQLVRARRAVASRALAARGVGATRDFQQKPSYTDEYRRSLARPEEFWAEAAQDIEWFHPFSKALDE
jgi:hypothetical protein